MGPQRITASLTALFFALLMTMAACGGSSHNPSSTGTNSGGVTPGSSNPGNTGGTGSGSGGGTSSGANSHFAYVVNEGGASISGFSQDSSTGALTALSGSPFKGAMESDGIAVLGNVLYVTQWNAGTSSIVSFGINSDGSLSQLATTPMSENVLHGLWTAGTQCLYGGTSSGDVLSWKAGGGGTLTSVSNLAQSLGPNLSIAASPDSKWLFVNFEQTSSGGFETDTYSIDTNSCAITRAQIGNPVGISPSTSMGKQPTWINMAVDGNSKYLFYADSIHGAVLASAIASNGTLTPVPGSPFSTGGIPFSPVANGNYLYVGDFGAALIYGFTIGPNGVLTPTSGSPYKNDMAPAYSMRIDPSGKFLDVADNDPGGIAVFSIGNTGDLTQISGSPYTNGGVSLSNPSWIAFK